MKSLKIIGMALATVLMGVGSMSCGKDGGEGTVVKEKKLVQFTYNDFNITFKYDDQGHVTEIVNAYQKGGLSAAETSTYVWGANTVDVNLGVKYGDEVVFQEGATINLVNGLATGIAGDGILMGKTAFSYDSSDRLVGYSGFVSNLTLEWDGDKLMSMLDATTMSGSSNLLTYSYGANTVTKGYNPILPIEVSTNYFFLAHPELSGISTRQLPDNVVAEYVFPDTQYEMTYDYTYEFDKDGYVVKITATSDADDEESTPIVYVMTWE